MDIKYFIIILYRNIILLLYIMQNFRSNVAIPHGFISTKRYNIAYHLAAKAFTWSSYLQEYTSPSKS